MEENKEMPVVEVDPTQPKEKLLDEDKAVFNQAKVNRELTLEKAKTAVAQSETADLAYNNVLLRLALKYGLADKDMITEAGEIVRANQK